MSFACVLVVLNVSPENLIYEYISDSLMVSSRSMLEYLFLSLIIYHHLSSINIRP